MIDIKTYGFTDPDLTDAARVTAVHKDLFEIVCARGTSLARLKSGAYRAENAQAYPTAGDYVRAAYAEHGESLIYQTLPRFSLFERSNYQGHAAGYVKTIVAQAVAANFNTAMLLASLNHDFNLRRLQRYVTMTYQSGAQPVVALTKADLVDDATVQSMVADTQSALFGIPVYALSAHTGQGLEQLSPYLAPGQTLVFLGSSGVGKSSLVNALAGQEIMAVKEIREDDSKGRHTTTHRQLMMMPCGAMVIDTPGMRELGMWNAEEGLGDAFADVEDILARGCRFSDCRHQSEPGCAVKKALDAGELKKERWEDYLALERESRFVQNKAAAVRDKNAWGKQIAMYNRTRVSAKRS